MLSDIITVLTVGYLPRKRQAALDGLLWIGERVLAEHEGEECHAN